MLKFFRFGLVSLALVVLIVPTGGHYAQAQETKSPSILEFFGIKPKKQKKQSSTLRKPPQRVSVQKKTKRANSVIVRKKVSPKTSSGAGFQSVARSDAAGSAPLPAIPEKLPNARTILVVGDFMADGVSEGIEQAFEGDAEVKIVSRANGSSGFIRDDFYNWTREITGIVAEIKPSVITVMIGTNDRQPLQLNGVRAAMRSSPWMSEYERRIADFSNTLKMTGIPIVWIGMPPFKQPSMNADMLAMNDIYRKNTERVSGAFVDIWDGFLDERGVFSIYGSDYIGQPARLRASDGINLTFAGKRKAAFFAEKPLRLALGDVKAVAILGFDPFNLPGPKLLNARTQLEITRLPPMSLFDPAFDGGSELLGAGTAPVETVSNKSSGQALYLDGISPKPVQGRIDQVNGAAAMPAKPAAP